MSISNEFQLRNTGITCVEALKEVSRIKEIVEKKDKNSLKKNSDPMEYQSQSMMRYNILFTQQLVMTIPLNTNLSAGDLIRCKFAL